MKTKKRDFSVNRRQAEFERILRLIPGYDPFDTAGDCVLDKRAVQDAIDFFPNCLTHVEGELAGKPFILEDWQKAIVGNLFGWKRPDGSRRYREVLIFVPRKNGKTPLVAGIALFILFCDAEFGQQNVCAAADTDQASFLFRQASGMVMNEPEMLKRAKIYEGMGQRSIVVPETRSNLKVISSDASTKHGGNLHLGLIDELHAQANRHLVDVIQTSMASKNRRQPMLIHVTTSDFERPGSICNEKHDYAKKVRDGVIEDAAFLPVIYEAALDSDWTNPETWKHANPNLGVSVSLDYLERECKRAQETAAYENTFKRLHLNIRTQQDVRWLPLEKWDACADEIDWSEYAHRDCYAGLDLASVSDLTALVLLFPEPDGKYTIKPYFWCPSVAATRRSRRDMVKYDSWIAEQFIDPTPGDVTDYSFIRKRINELSTQFAIKRLAVDRLFQGAQLCTDLMGDGHEVEAFGQGFASMAAPTKEWEELVVGQKIRHDGNPVMRWMISNVSVELDAAGNKKPSKKTSTDKIDGVVAGVMALGLEISQIVQEIDVRII